MLVKREIHSLPRTGGMVGFGKTAYFFGICKKYKTRRTVKLTDEANSYPAVLTEIQRGPYYAEVIWDKNLGGRAIAESRGMYTASR